MTVPRPASEHAREARLTWEGPWKIEGPWHHDTGYPQTWTVGNAHRTLCEAPTLQGAELVRDSLTALAVVDQERERLTRRLAVVRRMALHGPGPGTTPEQTLTTIAAFVDRTLAVPSSEPAVKELT